MDCAPKVCIAVINREKSSLAGECARTSAHFGLIFRYYYYSIEELGGRERGGGGGRTKPRPKPGHKTGTARFAHPLRGAEVLVAVRGPSPGEGGGKKKYRAT